MATKKTAPPPPAPSASDRFFEWMRGLGVTREPGWIGGVCAGVAARLGIDPIIVRGIAVVIAVLGGPALLLYAAAWLLLPDAENRILLERVLRGEFYGAIAGIGVLVLLALLPISPGFWFSGPWLWNGPYWGASVFRVLWTIAIVGAATWVVIWLVMRARSTPTVPGAPGGAGGPTPPPAPAPTDADGLASWKEQQAAWRQEHAAWRAEQAESARTLAREQHRLRAEEHAAHRSVLLEQERRSRSHPLFSSIAIGVALIVGAATTLVIGDGAWTSTAVVTGLAVMLGILGLAIVLNGFAGRRSGGASGLAVLGAIALLAAPVFGWVRGPIFSAGETTWSPGYSADGSSNRTVVGGDVDLDLTEYFAHATSHETGVVRLWIVGGDAEVTVPDDVAVDLGAYSMNGAVSIDGSSAGSGWFTRTEERVDPSIYPVAGTIELDIWAIGGTITIEHESDRD
jgi:phage shock protein PspC (stress-responsive transcriptional regulator)